MTIKLVLEDGARVRYATGSMMYFAQGIPYGLMNIAIPAWLASLGIGAGQIASYLKQALWTRVSVILMVVMFCDGLVNGYGHAVMPIAAIKLFGFTTPQWSQLVALMGLAGAVIALAFGPMIDRFGAKRMLFATVVLVAVHAFLLAQTQYLWRDTLAASTSPRSRPG